MGTFSDAATPVCRQHIESCLAIVNKRRAATAMEAARKPFRDFAAWHNTPEPFRRLVARSAGLAADVVQKLDRDLTEMEKAAIRAAASRLKERADALFAL